MKPKRKSKANAYKGTILLTDGRRISKKEARKYRPYIPADRAKMLKLGIPLPSEHEIRRRAEQRDGNSAQRLNSKLDAEFASIVG